MDDDKIEGLAYTQRSVAFPTLGPLESWHTDELSISAPSKGGGVYGEFNIIFGNFGGDHPAVEVAVFGDGLNVFYDERVQKVMAVWGNQPDPDKATPWDFIRWFEQVGAKPSRYHRDGIREAKSMPVGSYA